MTRLSLVIFCAPRIKRTSLSVLPNWPSAEKKIARACNVFKLFEKVAKRSLRLRKWHLIKNKSLVILVFGAKFMTRSQQHPIRLLSENNIEAIKKLRGNFLETIFHFLKRRSVAPKRCLWLQPNNEGLIVKVCAIERDSNPGNCKHLRVMFFGVKHFSNRGCHVWPLQ